MMICGNKGSYREGCLYTYGGIIGYLDACMVLDLLALYSQLHFFSFRIHTGEVGYGSNNRESLFGHRKEAKALMDG